MATRHIQTATVWNIDANYDGTYSCEIYGETKNGEPIGVVLHGLEDSDMATLAREYKRFLLIRKEDIEEQLNLLK